MIYHSESHTNGSEEIDTERRIKILQIDRADNRGSNHNEGCNNSVDECFLLIFVKMLNILKNFNDNSLTIKEERLFSFTNLQQ
jgi:hypothetical protein